MATEPTIASQAPKQRRVRNTRQKGDVFERLVRHRLESLGWFVLRSAGSRTPADLMCLVKGDAMVGLKSVALIQCKCTDRPLPKAERLALLEIADRHRMVDVFLARPGRGVGSVELVNLIGGLVLELVPVDDG